MANPDLRSIDASIGAVDYPSPTAFEDVGPDDFKVISAIQWFTHQAVLADADNDFVALLCYAWDGEFFYGITVDSLSSRV